MSHRESPQGLGPVWEYYMPREENIFVSALEKAVADGDLIPVDDLA